MRGQSFRRGAVALGVVLMLSPTGAAADNLLADGDLAIPVAANPVSFGTVCAGSTVGRPVLIALQRSGSASSGQVFASGSGVQLVFTSVTGGPEATFLSPSPASIGHPIGVIGLPSNWATSVPDGALSYEVGGTLFGFPVALAPTTPGSFNGTIALEARGTNTAGQPLTRATTVAVTATVVACGDTTPPQLSLPAPITAEATGPAGVSLTFLASASDQNPASPPVTCKPASGSVFPLGTTSVACSATDAAGNTAHGSFTVTVVDTAGPVIGDADDVTIEAVSADGATVSYDEPAAEDAVDGPRPVTCTPASGTTLPLGTSTVTCRAEDSRGNTASRQFTVRVQDTTGPAMLLPAGVTAEASSDAGAAVGYTASAEDAVDGALTPTCSPASGAVFPLGTTTVSCSVVDAAGNSTSGTFPVTVVDTTPPALADRPSPKTAEATGPDGATVSYTSPTATDLVDGPVPVTCTPEPGTTFPLGTTTVTCAAEDSRGNRATAGFTVTVLDSTPPELTLPADQMAAATSPDGAPVVFEATATDQVDGPVTATCQPPTGATFPIGTSTVTCRAEDAAGNPATGSFTVIVRRAILGFYAPVDGARLVNTIRGGRTVPLKFEVFAGPTELTSTDLVAPISIKRFNCDPSAPMDPLEVTATGETSLRYDPTEGLYIFNWKTPTPRNVCYQIAVSTTDGATTTGLFRTT